MKNKFLVFFFILQISSLFGQDINTESLIEEADSLENVEKYKESIIIWDKLLKNPIAHKEPLYLLRSFYAKGKNEVEKGNHKGAAVYFEQAISFIPKIKPTERNKTAIANLYSDLYLFTGYSGDWKKALKYVKIGYDYVLKNTPKDIDALNFIQDMGYIQNELREYEASIVSYEKVLKLVYQLHPKDYERIGLVHNQLAIGYSDLHFHNQSLYHYTKGLDFHKKSEGVDKSYIVNAANNVIWENLDYGDDKKAKNVLAFLNKNFYKWYIQKDFASINRGNEKYGKLHFKTLLYLSNLRCNAFDKKKYLAKQYLDSIALVFQIYPDDVKKNYNTLLLSRYSYAELLKDNSNKNSKDIENHIDFNKKTVEIAKQQESKHDELVASLQLAVTYNKYNKHDEALKVIEEAKKISESFFNASRFSIEILEATVLNAKNKNKESRKVLLRSYQKLIEKQMNLKNLKQLKYSNFKKYNSGTFIRNVIASATICFKMYEKEHKREDLIIANNLFFIASDMFGEFYQKGKYNYSLNAFNKEIASGLLQTQLLIDPNDDKKIKNILNKIENNSSQHLWNIFEVKNSQNLKVPSHLIQEYNQLIFERNNILSIEEINGKTRELEQDLANLEKKIEEKQKKINQYDSSYQKFKSSDFTIEKIQNQLTNKQLIIKYVVTDKKTFALAIKKNSVNLLEIENTNQLKATVSKNTNLLSTINSNFKKSTKKLYSKLIEPIVKNNSFSSIIFVPEDFLNTVSFESLQNNEGEFLTQNCTVSYAYSLKLWDFLQQNNILKIQKNQFVSFAPNYSKIPELNQVRELKRGNLFDLTEAKNEAKTISDLFNGKLFLNENATKNNFLKSTTTYNCHHLAMHSMLEEDYSKSSLVFTNQQKVYFNELYQLNFPSKMVVLSACSTGLGVQESGEGIMSLSRALAYSGVKSSVYSLWQVPDKETSEIMISFYKNLKKGQAKDEALANAKNTFIKKNPMKNHPFYWAGFIVNGDVSPIVTNSYNWIIYVSIALLCLGLLFVFRKKLPQFSK